MLPDNTIFWEVSSVAVDSDGNVLALQVEVKAYDSGIVALRHEIRSRRGN